MSKVTWSYRVHELYDRTLRQRARRAEQRQRMYQAEKALHLAGTPEQMTPHFVAQTASVRRCIERFRRIDPDARVLEVGSGAHGHIFFLGLRNSIGLDPLADIYPGLFPEWQRNAKTLRGYGEALPFEDASFDLVLSDNVIDHAERPAAILAELARVLRPGGILYFTVNIHHPIYAVASTLHGAWNAVGLKYEIGPFADHTVHFTLDRIRARIGELPLRVLSEDTGIAAAKRDAARTPPRHGGDLLKRMFFKNARFEIVALRR